MQKDLTLTRTYIAKSPEMGVFAHGDTIESAMNCLQHKVIQDLDIDERIELFLNEVDIMKKHTVQCFYDWHGTLTCSCQQGRLAFLKGHELKMTDELTVDEFIEMTKNEYGNEVILKLAEKIKDKGDN